jgi:glycosyltransferase involved in cell wall biosynthesis
MRVLYLNPVGTVGGAEKSLLDILEALRIAEPEWRLGLIAGGEGPLTAKAASIGVSAKEVRLPHAIAALGDAGNRAWGSLAGRAVLLGRCLRAAAYAIPYLIRLRGVIRDFAPDVIHSNGFKMHFLGLWSRPRGTPVIWHIRDYVSSRPVMKRLLQSQGGRCSLAIANSASVEGDVRRVLGPEVETCCIYNVVDLTHYAPVGAQADVDRLSGLPPAEPGTVRVGLVATFARWKGHEVFLKAIARLQPLGLRLRAFVIGGPIYQTEGSQLGLDALRRLAADLGIGDRVGFTGFIEDTASAMRALDVIVHASTEPEPFGRVIAEGMACGRPVISSATGGAYELIQENYNALVHPPGDYVVLAERIAELVRDKELRIRMGHAGRITAESRFERSRLARQLIPIYRRIVAPRESRVPAESLLH